MLLCLVTPNGEELNVFLCGYKLLENRIAVDTVQVDTAVEKPTKLVMIQAMHTSDVCVEWQWKTQTPKYHKQSRLRIYQHTLHRRWPKLYLLLIAQSNFVSLRYYVSRGDFVVVVDDVDGVQRGLAVDFAR